MTIIDLTSKSKNYTKGREGKKVKFLAIHWLGTKGATGESSAYYLLGNSNNTSTHFVVEDARVWKVVNTEDTAHAVGNWNNNLESISIEVSATVDREANEATYQTVAVLIKQLCYSYQLSINKDTIKPHKAFSATVCPGTIDIPKLIKLATEGNIESQKDIKIKELEKEKDKFEKLSIKQAKTIDTMTNDAQILVGEIEALKKERDVFHDLSERTSEEVKDLKVSVDKAVQLASDWEVEVKEIKLLQKEKDKTQELKDKEQKTKDIETKVEIDVLKGSYNTILKINQELGTLITVKKRFRYKYKGKNYSLVLIEDLGKK